MDNLISTKLFISKSATKKWLAENTTFLYPDTVVPLQRLDKILACLGDLPVGDYVLKPDTGKQSRGVVLFERTLRGIKLVPTNVVLPINKAVKVINAAVYKRSTTRLGVVFYDLWFIEKWVIPHERFHQFTDDKKCPPIIRLCGRPNIHFIGMSPMHEKSTGLSAAGWQNRKYIWIDLEGNIRPLSDMNLKGVDLHSVKVAHNQSLENVPVDLKIEGIKELIGQVNAQISDKLILRKDQGWSCDGIFNENNEFVVIEMNSRPGLKFKGFSWES